MVYKLCEAMEKTCSKPNPRVPSVCVTGCFCEEGYVKSPDGQCVKLEECPKAQVTTGPTTPVQTKNSPAAPYHNISPATPAYPNIGPATPGHPNMGPATPAHPHIAPATPALPNIAPATLAQATIGPEIPDQVKVQLLIGPMYYDSQPSHHDPSVEDCGPDEVYYSCGWCEPSCSDPLPICPNKVCIRGCLCRPPLLRHHTGYCVEATECFPEKCKDPNEEFVCLFGCELRCDQRCVRPRYCVLGCYCRIGLLRDNTGLCVVKDKCSNSTEVKDVAVDLKIRV